MVGDVSGVTYFCFIKNKTKIISYALIIIFISNVNINAGDGS
jgi:hypothetical protein